MVTHRLPCFSYNFYLLANSTCWPLSLSFFLLANSTCWPNSFLLFFYWPTQRVGISHFFYWPTQCVGLSLFFVIIIFWLANSTCWPFIIQPDGSHRLLLVAFPHARKIFLEVLAIDGYRKLDTIKFFKHVRISRQDLINLVRSMPSWRPLTILPIFSSQW